MYDVVPRLGATTSPAATAPCFDIDVPVKPDGGPEALLKVTDLYVPSFSK